MAGAGLDRRVRKRTRPNSGPLLGVSISPCGRFVATSSEEFNDGKQYICVHDFERGVTTRITDGGREWHPSWTPAGDKIVYDSTEGYTSCAYEIDADGSAPPEIILEPGSVLGRESADGSIVCSRLVRGVPHLQCAFRIALNRSWLDRELNLNSLPMANGFPLPSPEVRASTSGHIQPCGP